MSALIFCQTLGHQGTFHFLNEKITNPVYKKIYIYFCTGRNYNPDKIYVENITVMLGLTLAPAAPLLSLAAAGPS